MEIRNFQLEDIEKVHELERVCYGATILQRDLVVEKNGGVVVALDGENIVGFGRATFVPIKIYQNHKLYAHLFESIRGNDPKGIMYLCDDVVHPDFRRNGIWGKLIEARLEYARQKTSIEKVAALGRIKENHVGPATAQFLKKMGFKEISIFGDGELLELYPPYQLSI